MAGRMSVVVVEPLGLLRDRHDFLGVVVVLFLLLLWPMVMVVLGEVGILLCGLVVVLLLLVLVGIGVSVMTSIRQWSDEVHNRLRIDVVRLMIFPLLSRRLLSYVLVLDLRVSLIVDLRVMLLLRVVRLIVVGRFRLDGAVEGDVRWSDGCLAPHRSLSSTRVEPPFTIAVRKAVGEAHFDACVIGLRKHTAKLVQ
uniref:Uncharacterized protein n=1 Tax=Anopheles atroparvus TaxID=41427 RepID=A0A182J7Z2_ANOAO